MKAEDVVAALKANLPRFTEKFSETAEITSLTQSAGIATAISAAPHDLISGDLVNLTGALTPNIVTSITRAGVRRA